MVERLEGKVFSLNNILHFKPKQCQIDYRTYPFFRHGITFKEVSGKSEKVTKDMTAPWEETTLLTIIARYKLNDIFNAGEFGLFYVALPSKSFHFQGKQCSGGKHSKVRLTGIAASNALSEKKGQLKF